MHILSSCSLYKLKKNAMFLSKLKFRGAIKFARENVSNLWT